MSRSYPKGPKINFFLAIIAQMLPGIFPTFDPLAFAIDNAKFGDLTYYRLGPLRIYQINAPDLVRQILIEQPEKFYKPRFIKRAFAPFAGNGLLTSDGAQWKQQRKLMQPAFHHSQLATYGEITTSQTLQMMDKFRDGVRAVRRATDRFAPVRRATDRCASVRRAMVRCVRSMPKWWS